MVGLLGDTRLGGFYRSTAYRRILRVGGGLAFVAGLAFASSVTVPPPRGQVVRGFSGKAFTIVRWADVASSDLRGRVMCVAEPNADTAWDVARYVGKLDEGASYDFVVVSVVRRFVIPIRAPQMTATVLSQASPGAWRLASREVRDRVLRVTARVCVLQEDASQERRTGSSVSE
jgi:hypothetical protein